MRRVIGLDWIGIAPPAKTQADAESAWEISGPMKSPININLLLYVGILLSVAPRISTLGFLEFS